MDDYSQGQQPQYSNPYQTPTQMGSSPGSQGNRGLALEKVKLPAILMMVTVGLMLVLYPLALIGNLLNIGIGADAGGEDGAIMMFQGGFGIVQMIFGIIISVVMLIGSRKMLKLESRGWAMTTMILGMLPCISPCCVFGLPIGIWGIVVLNDPVVKGAFPR